MEKVIDVIVKGIKHVAYHAVIIWRNARVLFLVLLRGTTTWVYMLGRLVLFTVILIPGFFHMLKFWLLSPFILRNVEYGKGVKNRNLLDVYLPKTYNPHRENSNSNQNPSSNSKKKTQHPSNKLVPVVIFVSGGAWTIGYKLWSALVAQGLSRLGILTIVPDYRNFPQGDIEDMMCDVSMAVEWTVLNAYRFGGDSNKIVLAGQSAGAHICSCLLVHEFIRDFNMFGQEGEYEQSLNSKDTSTSIDSQAEKQTKNPPKDLTSSSSKTLRSFLPVALFHGSKDKTIPPEISVELANVLSKNGAEDVSLTVYDGWSHTDAILEGPFAGDSMLFEDMWAAVMQYTNTEEEGGVRGHVDPHREGRGHADPHKEAGEELHDTHQVHNMSKNSKNKEPIKDLSSDSGSGDYIYTESGATTPGASDEEEDTSPRPTTQMDPNVTVGCAGTESFGATSNRSTNGLQPQVSKNKESVKENRAGSDNSEGSESDIKVRHGTQYKLPTGSAKNSKRKIVNDFIVQLARRANPF